MPLGFRENSIYSSYTRKRFLLTAHRTAPPERWRPDTGTIWSRYAGLLVYDWPN
jgi:hypothetical protein